MAMTFFKTATACIIAIGMSNAATAEIYETKDAQGNTVFTDTPTAAAEEVVLPNANIADAVKAAPQPAPAATSKPAAVDKAAAQDNVIVIHDNRDELLADEIVDQRPREVMEAKRRHEVEDLGKAERTGQVQTTGPVQGAHPAGRPHVGHRR